MSRLFLAFVIVIGLGVVAESADSIRHEMATSYPASIVPHPMPWLSIHPEMADQIVVYSATWCGPCHQLSPVLQSLEQNGCKVVHRDVDRDINALKHENNAVPTIYFVRNNVAIRTETEYRSKEHIKQTLMPELQSKPH